MKNYKLSNFSPRNINHHARNISIVPIMPHDSVWLYGPRVIAGSRSGVTKNRLVNT